MLKLVIVLASLVVMAYGFSYGAPDYSCNDMIPEHHIPPQESPLPYAINADFNNDNGLVQVNITGPKPFVGFLVEGRVGNQIVGSFVNTPENVKLLNCGSGKENGATHTKNLYRSELSLLWQPPKNLNDEVVFWVTVVQNFGTFWVGALSNSVKVN